MRSLIASIAAAVLTAMTVAAAHGFGTVNAIGQQAEHERITRLGLKSFGIGPKTMAMTAGAPGSFGAVGAPDNPAFGLMGTKAAHCDGGDTLDVPGYPQARDAAAAQLKACRDWIVAKLKEAVTDAGAILDAQGRIDDSQIPTLIACTFNNKKGRAKCNVLEDIGLALHAAQDFYSHSNWTDKPAAGAVGPSNPPGLGKSGRSPWLDPRTSGTFPAGLISGCYDGWPEGAHCANRVKHQSLNKDTGSIDLKSGAAGAGTSERGKLNGNFAHAVTAAIDDTRDKWAYFEERVRATYGAARGQRIICAIRSDDPSGCK